MKIVADNTGFSIFISNEKIFRFNSCVFAEINGDMKKEEVSAFETVADKYIWKTNSGTTYTLAANENSAVFSITLKADGKLGQVEYLKTDEYYASGFYSPIVGPNGDVGLYKPMNDSEQGCSTFFAPYPLCYVFNMEDCDKMLGVSLIAEAGKYNFDSFQYNYDDKIIYFSTDFMEYTTVNGEYKLPDLVFFEGTDRFDILKKYSSFHYEKDYIEKSEHTIQNWWKESSLCGWGDQWIIAANDTQGNDAAWDEEAVAENANAERNVMSTFDKAIAISDETTYRNIIKKADDKNIEYGTLIIDCKWQKAFGTMEVDTNKWSDLRGFIDEMHESGKKVLLWFNFWSVEGLPLDECITEDGEPIYVDPTNPKYIERMDKIMQYLLSDSDGCCNADGFKIDFVSIPDKKNLKIYENGICGIELLKRRAELIYKSAKKAKKDALISSQHVHPYFDSAMDMMRIGDYFSASNRAKENLYTRVGILNSVLPEILADTDAPSGANRHDALVYFRHSAKLGIPSIYGIDIYDRFFDDKDWTEIAGIYKNYRNNL